MQKNSRRERKSPIIIGENDHGRLSLLAEKVANLNESLSETLIGELERAKVVPDPRVPTSVVQMGSTVVWRTEKAEEHRAKLVFPGDADINNGKVSILTPVGVALIGLSTGQVMEWMTRDGRSHALTVLKVEKTLEATVRSMPSRASNDA